MSDGQTSEVLFLISDAKEKHIFACSHVLHMYFTCILKIHKKRNTQSDTPFKFNELRVFTNYSYVAACIFMYSCIFRYAFHVFSYKFFLITQIIRLSS